MPLKFHDYKCWRMKRGWGTCGTFKAFNLTYLHVLRSGMVYITLWYVHLPRYGLGQKCIEQYNFDLERTEVCERTQNVPNMVRACTKQTSEHTMVCALTILEL